MLKGWVSRLQSSTSSPSIVPSGTSRVPKPASHPVSRSTSSPRVSFSMSTSPSPRNRPMSSGTVVGIDATGSTPHVVGQRRRSTCSKTSTSWPLSRWHASSASTRSTADTVALDISAEITTSGSSCDQNGVSRNGSTVRRV
jgi:hypothetical protein